MTHAGEQYRIAEEIAGFDHKVDAHDVHQQHAARADVEMADFAVAHLAVRQAHGGTGGLDQHVGVLAQEPVVGRFSRGGDGVAFYDRGKSPAIENGQD